MEELRHETDGFLLSMVCYERLTGESITALFVRTKDEGGQNLRIVLPDIKDKEKVAFEHARQILESQGPYVGTTYLQDTRRFMKDVERLAAKKEGEKIGDATLTTTKTVGRKKV